MMVESGLVVILTLALFLVTVLLERRQAAGRGNLAGRTRTSGE